jgi:UDP-N-acetyl-2-amino-2-deoxyglucuronate dehydrogenase
MANFALVGLGYISDKHIKAIQENGNKLVVACDIDERTEKKVKDICFFVEDYRQLKHYDFDWISICTPNYTHYDFCRYFDSLGKNIICEKPFIIEDYNHLEYKGNINIIHQLRYSKEFQRLKNVNIGNIDFIEMDINIHRGIWYQESWKNDEKKSGGLLLNIGVHYFDILFSLLGIDFTVLNLILESNYSKGTLLFKEKILVDFNITTLVDKEKQKRLFKVYYKDGTNEEYNFNDGIENLHTENYKQIFDGNGVKPKEAIRLIENINYIKEYANGKL